MRDKLGIIETESKAKTRKSSAFWTTVGLLLLCVMMPSSAIQMKSFQPVLWRPSQTPVTSGNYQVYLKIKLLSPCEVLTAEVIHKDSVNEAKKRCSEMYEELFIAELTKMCPAGATREMIVRSKRFIFTFIIGTIIVALIAGVALGTAGVAVAISNSAKISSIKETMELQENQMKELEEKIGQIEGAVRKLETEFRSLVRKLEIHEEDFQELKYKQIGTSFAVSYITNRLMLGKHIIMEANRQWKQKKIYPPLLDFYNFTLPCGDDCPIHLATQRGCRLFDKNVLLLDFDVPMINSTLQLLEADPFELMLKKSNKTCTIVYTGPRNIIISKTDECTFAMNVKPHSSLDLILSPSRGCIPHTELPSESKYFAIERCEPEHPNDELDFIQVKPHHGSNYVYCAGSSISIDGKYHSCPEEVFLLPISASFRINDFEFKGSLAHLDHQETLDPLFSIRANWHLQPKLNLSDLVMDSSLSQKEKGNNISNLNHPMTWSTLTLSILIFILLSLIIGYLIKSRKLKVSVVAQPMEMELQELRNQAE